MKIRKFIVGFIILLTANIYIFNASWRAESQAQNRQILAHRGLHQTFNPVGVTNKTCTASRIDTPRHNHIENTLPAIQAALDMGADIIEFDVHPTTDGEFVVFHDWAVDCRTDGTGITRNQTFAYLKSLDIGHGYTADGGKSYPFRGKFIGALPSLNEVLTAFPDTLFLINIKSKSTAEAKALTAYLKNKNHANLSAYGAGGGIDVFAKLNLDIKTLSKPRAKACLKSYLLTGWSGHMPKPCHNTYVPVPENYQWAVWGWPNKFESRLKKVGSRALLMGPHIKGKANSGIDDIASFKNIPSDFGGIIWTNRIDLIGATSPAPQARSVPHH